MLQYKDIVSPHTLLPRRRVPVLSDGAGGQYFKAHFPFSSMIYQLTSQILSESKNLPGLFVIKNCKCLLELRIENEANVASEVWDAYFPEKINLIILRGQFIFNSHTKVHERGSCPLFYGIASFELLN